MNTTTNFALKKPEGTDYYNIEDFNDNADTIDEALAATLMDIAPVYNPSLTYLAGSLVLYENVLYKCNTDISIAEEWTPAHWTAVSVKDMLDEKVAAKDRTGTLTTSGWSNKSQTIAVVGLDPEDTAIVSIDSSDASGYEAARDSDIRLTGRANGTLTFSCEDVPTSNIGVVITILE